jgi:uncharacterized protein YecT (DUF1311 family)
MRLILFVFTTLVICPKAFSQPPTKSYKIDTILNKCIDKTNGGDISIISCLQKAEMNWDAELNKTFRLLLSKLDSSDQRKLREAQRQWIIYKDKEIKFFTDVYGKQDGTMWNLSISDKRMQLIRQRTVELLDYYEILTQN